MGSLESYKTGVFLSPCGRKLWLHRVCLALLGLGKTSADSAMVWSRTAYPTPLPRSLQDKGYIGGIENLGRMLLCP